jgi:hypothetical protein
MRSASGPTRGWLLRLAVLTFLFALSCAGNGASCGGSSCAGGCGGSGAYTFPLNDPSRPDAVVQSEVARARITQSFIDFIQPRLPDLIRGALMGSGQFTIDGNNVVSIRIPDQNDIVDVSVAGIGLVGLSVRNAVAKLYLDDLRPCVGANRNRCMLLEFVDTPANEMGVRLALYELRLGIRLNAIAELLGSDASCPIFGDLGNDVAAQFSINVLIQPGVGPDPARNVDVDVTVGQVELVDLAVDVAGRGEYCSLSQCQDCALEVGNTCLDPGGRCNECVILCGGVVNGVAALSGALIDLVRPLLNRALTPVVQNFVRSALGDLNNQSAKVEAQVKLSDLAPIAALKAAGPFGIFVAPEVGKFPVVRRNGDKGMEITISGGSEAALADCVSNTDFFAEAKGPTPELLGLDGRGRPYHLGFTLAQSLINNIFYSVYRSGSLCLQLSSQDVKELTDGGFSLNASLLSLLASDLTRLAEDTAPVIVQLKPRNPPRLDLGSGTRTGTDAMGRAQYDWLMKVALEDVGIAFHVLVQDRYVRIFEVTSDIRVGLNVNVLPDNKLELAVGELKIDGFQEIFNELLPNADFSMILPSLIDVGLSAFLNQELTFDVDVTDALAGALGVPIYMRVNEVKRDGPQEDFLTVTMTFSDQPGAPLVRPAETFAALADDPGLELRVDGKLRPSGQARLVVGDPNAALIRRVEYQTRVDGGLWRAWQAPNADGTLWVDDPKLFLSGKHVIDVRARLEDDYMTLDRTPVRLVAQVDTTPPRVQAELRGDQVVGVVTDVGLGLDGLRVRARFDEGAPIEVPVTQVEARGTIVLGLAGHGDAYQVELVATDARGNASAPARVIVGRRPTQDAPTAPLADVGQGEGCACTATETRPAADPRGLATGVLTLALLGLRRRGRR